jgi:hypothetical protein
LTVERHPRDLALSMDVSGKQLFRGYVYALVALVVLACWTVVGAEMGIVEVCLAAITSGWDALGRVFQR